MDAKRLLGLGIFCETQEQMVSVLHVLERQYPKLRWSSGDKPTDFPVDGGAITYVIRNQEYENYDSPACIRWQCHVGPGDSKILVHAAQFLQEPMVGTSTRLARRASSASAMVETGADATSPIAACACAVDTAISMHNVAEAADARGMGSTGTSPCGPTSTVSAHSGATEHDGQSALCPRCSDGFETLWPQSMVCPACNYPGRLLRNRPSHCRHPRIRVTHDDAYQALCLTCSDPLVLDGLPVLHPRSGLEPGFWAPCPHGVVTQQAPSRSVLLRAPDFLAEQNPWGVFYLEEHTLLRTDDPFLSLSLWKNTP